MWRRCCMCSRVKFGVAYAFELGCASKLGCWCGVVCALEVGCWLVLLQGVDARWMVICILDFGCYCCCRVSLRGVSRRALEDGR